MPGISHNHVPDGISIQDVMKAGPLPSANGDIAPADVVGAEGGGGRGRGRGGGVGGGSGRGVLTAEVEEDLKCRECKAVSKAARCCDGCWQVWYCSRAHQVKGWPAHKSKCRPWRVAHSPLLGRYMVASKDIPAGEFLLADSPIIIGPKQLTEPLCLACYRPADGSYRCKRCGFPMCDIDCQEAEGHQPECNAVHNSGRPVKVTLYGETNSLYECITPIRILSFKNSDPSLWTRILNLESHSAQRELTATASITQRTVVDIIIERLRIQEFESEMIHRILGILDTNAFEIRLPDSAIQGVYDVASMLEHSCIPNVHRTFDADLNLVLRTSINVKRGDHLANCYTDSLTTTAVRQDHLLVSKYFTCTCKRCSDPTELGTYLSAFLCPDCAKSKSPVKAGKSSTKENNKQLAKSTAKTDTGSETSEGNKDKQPHGFVVAQDPLSPSSPWVCLTCCSPLDTDYVVRITAVMNEEAEEIEQSTHSISLCEAFLEKWSSTYPTNQANLINIKYVLIHLYGSQDGYSLEELNPIHLIRKEQLCRDILRVADVILPGVSRLRGSVLYELYQALFYKTKSMFSVGVITTDMAKKIAQEAYDSLLECARVLSYEPAVQPEGQLGLEAKQEVGQMSKWIKDEGWKY